MILLIIRAQPLSVLCKEGPKPSQVSYSDFPGKKKMSHLETESKNHIESCLVGW